MSNWKIHCVLPFPLPGALVQSNKKHHTIGVLSNEYFQVDAERPGLPYEGSGWVTTLLTRMELRGSDCPVRDVVTMRQWFVVSTCHHLVAGTMLITSTQLAPLEQSISNAGGFSMPGENKAENCDTPLRAVVSSPKIVAFLSAPSFQMSQSKENSFQPLPRLCCSMPPFANPGAPHSAPGRLVTTPTRLTMLGNRHFQGLRGDYLL